MDDLDLLRSSGMRAYFDTKEEALQFAEENKFKRKPKYWQPYIWKEKQVEHINYEWIEVKGESGE